MLVQNSHPSQTIHQNVIGTRVHHTAYSTTHHQNRTQNTNNNIPQNKTREYDHNNLTQLNSNHPHITQ